MFFICVLTVHVFFFFFFFHVFSKSILIFFSFLCLSSTNQTNQIQNLDKKIINIHQPKSRNQHTPTKIQNPEIVIHQQSNP